jgi:hypothetical protein
MKTRYHQVDITPMGQLEPVYADGPPVPQYRFIGRFTFQDAEDEYAWMLVGSKDNHVVRIPVSKFWGTFGALKGWDK